MFISGKVNRLTYAGASVGRRRAADSGICLGRAGFLYCLFFLAVRRKTAAVRISAVAEDARRPHGGDWIRNYTSYQQLSALLDTRKSSR